MIIAQVIVIRHIEVNENENDYGKDKFMGNGKEATEKFSKGDFQVDIVDTELWKQIGQFLHGYVVS